MRASTNQEEYDREMSNILNEQLIIKKKEREQHSTDVR